MGRGRRERGQRAVVAQHTQVTYSGPIPPAAQFAQYEQVCPGAADRLLRMAEGQQAHRQHLEAAVVGGNLKAQTRGAWFAFVLALGVLGLGGWLIVHGQVSIGLWLILTDVVALAGVFFTGRWLQSRERKQRRQELEGASER